MIPPLFNHSTPGASTNHTPFSPSSERRIDRSSELHWHRVCFLFLQALSAPYLKNGHQVHVPQLKVHSHCAYMLHAWSPFHSLWRIMVLAEWSVQVCWSLCMRASRFRAQVPRSPRTVMARYHSRAGGCAWSRYPAPSRWQARCPSTSGLRLAPTLGRRRLERTALIRSVVERIASYSYATKSTDLMIDVLISSTSIWS
jgi:hypothetical protein